MSIEQKQRNKNTQNKFKELKKEAYDYPLSDHAAGKGRKHGVLGQELVSASRSAAMDNDTGSHDYTGGPSEYRRANAIMQHLTGMAHGPKARQATKELMGYGSGHDMEHHGEGKPYGDK